MYRLVCPCGKETEVRGSQAGCQVTCDCGRESQVPALSELKDHQERNEAAPAHDLLRSEPNLFFYHCCGKVGRDGEVSLLAMNHYVELVRGLILDSIKCIEQASFRDFVLSIAIAPDNKKLIEFDRVPKDTTLKVEELLREKISEIKVPAIRESPIAFAFYASMRPSKDVEGSLLMFPSLSNSVKSFGMEAAIREAFGMAPGDVTSNASTEPEPRREPWWKKLFGRKSKRSNIQPIPSAQEKFLAQERWIQQCEEQANVYSWIDLKRVIMDAPDDPRYQVTLAAKHFQHQAWALTIECYDRLINQFGDIVPLLGRRAASYRNAGNSQAALIDYSRAIEKAPHESSFWYQRSFIYSELLAWEQAARDLDEAIQLAPIDPELFFYRALVRLQQDKTAEAVDDFREAIRLDPNFGYAHFRLGWLYSCVDAEKGTAAIEHLSRAVMLTNDNDIRLHRGLAYLAQNKFALAMEDCDYVLAVESDNALAHGVRGRVLQAEGQFDDAIVACTRAIELGHEHAAVFLARAVSYASTDQLTCAASDCDAALAFEPNNAWAIHIRGRLKLKAGDLDAAMDAFHRARELAPDWAEPRVNLSLVHRMKENPRASVEEQTLLIERQPKLASHYVNRAFAFTQLQEYQKAASDYDRAIELEPEDERLYFLRGVFRANCQEPELALADFERVLTITGGDDDARANRASLLIQLKRYQEAIDDYAQLIAKYPENPHAYSGRAYAWAALGNTARAQDDANRVIEISPELADGIHRSTETADLYRLMRDEDYDSALDAANRMVADYPDESIGYRLRAYVRWEREEFVEACEDYTRVIEMDGPSSSCFSSRGQVQAELGEWDQALADLNQAVDMARQAGQTIVLAYALNGRSLALAGMERDEESSRDFGESVSLCPTNPWVYYHRGIRMFYLNALTDAKVLLELALEFNDPPLSKRKKQRARMVLETMSNKSDKQE